MKDLVETKSVITRTPTSKIPIVVGRKKPYN